jgi:hypothetical protein
VLNPLALRVLEAEFEPGDRVEVDHTDEGAGLVVRRAARLGAEKEVETAAEASA